MAKLKRVVDDALTCAVCLYIIDYPKVLPCLHTFCRKCLNEVINTSSGDDVRCPICNAVHSVSPAKGVDGFRTNFTLQNLKEARSVSEADNDSSEGFGIRCENGLDENRGVSRCIDCSCFLCEVCQDQHKKLKATRNHRIVSLTDIKNDVRKLEYKRSCIDHEEEELKLFCKDCQEVICRDCTIVNHKGHDYQFIKTICPQLQEDIKKILENELERKCNEFDDHLAHLHDVKETSEDNIKYCRENVCRYFEEFKRRLDIHQGELLEELDIAQGDRSKQLETQQEVVETSKAKLDSSKEFTMQLLQNGIPVDIALMYKQTVNRLSNLKEESWDRNSAQPSRWVFVADDDKNDPFKSKVRGGISRGDLLVEGLGQPTPGLNTFKVSLESEIDATCSNLVVTVMNENGEQLPDVDIKRSNTNQWDVSYIIEEDGEYVISVLLDGVEAQTSPFVRRWYAKLLQGMKVSRGNDWKWGDQDGGLGGVGTVMGWSDEVGASNNWAKIKWESTNRQNNYRWGSEGAYDLQVVITQQQ